ncbi:MAG: SdpI family protein [Sediminibacterium sp.]
MKKTNQWSTLFTIAIICLPALYAASIYSSLPATIPVHFGIDGKPNGFADKDSLWVILLTMAGVSAGLYLLINNLARIDPKKAAGQSPEMYHKIAMAIVIFLCALTLVIIYSSVNGSVNINKLMLPLMGLFFSVLGNYMHSIKPNYFVGFRTPWALENEDNWRKTHQLVGKIWVPGGLLMAISTLVLPAGIAFIVFVSIVSIMVAIPAVFSYLYYKSHQPNQ